VKGAYDKEGSPVRAMAAAVEGPGHHGVGRRGRMSPHPQTSNTTPQPSTITKTTNKRQFYHTTNIYHKPNHLHLCDSLSHLRTIHQIICSKLNGNPLTTQPSAKVRVNQVNYNDDYHSINHLDGFEKKPRENNVRCWAMDA